MRKKRLYISMGIIGAIGVTVTAIAVPASLRTHDEKYEVSIAKANGAHYTILRLNPSTNKGIIPNKNIWDIDKADQNAINVVAASLDMKVVSQLLPTISNKKDYTNGLEKFIYDLLRLENNGDNLTIISPAKNSKGENYKIKFEKEFINPNGNEKSKITFRANKLKDMLKNKDQNSINFQKGLEEILIYDKTSNSVIKTSQKIILDAINKFSK